MSIPNPVRRAALPLALSALLAGCQMAPPAPGHRMAPVPKPAADDAYDALVSAADPRAAAAGREMLAAGGGAIDAAIATMLALNVVEPQSSGIGGGGFLLYHDAATGKAYALDGRETAPAASTPDMFIGPDGKPLAHSAAVPGGKSVGVPGNVRLIEAAHKRFGKLPWAKLFEPAIRLARGGFTVTPRLHRYLSERAAHAGTTPWARATYFNADGSARAVGAVIHNPALAAFMGRLAKGGADIFYQPPAATQLAAAVATAATSPQAMKASDLAGYKAKWRAPVCAEYRQWQVCGMPPPSSGGTTVLAILEQLEPFDLAGLGPDSPESWHLIAESMRLAYADREAYVGDPDVVDVPTAGLVDAAYLKQRSRLIDPKAAAATVLAGAPPGAPEVASVPDGEVPSTSHFVTVDASGDVATYTSTIEGVWGSGLTVNGFFLNNELTDFSFAPKKAGRLVPNSVAPGKRPRSSMAPTIVYDSSGRPILALGAAGGPTIIAQVAKAVIGVLDWKLTPEQAIALPQLYSPGDTVFVESGSRLEAMAPALDAMGHHVEARALPLKANAAERLGGAWIGGADPRSEGAVTGLRH